MLKKVLWILPVLAIGMAIGSLTLSNVFASNTPFAAQLSNSANTATPSGTGFTGMMGGMGSMMGNATDQFRTLTKDEANRDMESSLTNATVDKENNSITYSGKSDHIVIFGGAMDDDTAGPAEKFVIDGLVNPTLHVQKGANISLEFINEDTDMPHGIEVSTASPPYGYMSMMEGGIYASSIIAPIPESNNNNFPMASTSFTAAELGTYYYLCQYPGHAAEGMYGKMVIS